MIVSELIAHLQALPQDAQVHDGRGADVLAPQLFKAGSLDLSAGVMYVRNQDDWVILAAEPFDATDLIFL